MPTLAAITPADEGIDRKELRRLLTRFRAISAARLERVRGMLAPRQRQFLDLLPLLLHIDHPALPGYVSQHTPCGISGYTPSATELAQARRLALSFSPQRLSVPEPRLHAVYLMGSSGTLGHSDGSDLDIWICYPEELGSEELALLARKAVLLQQWAHGIGLEAHLFLMNGEKFKRGQRDALTGENCGTAQHYLLLDEFYRTAILLAGRVPAWWLIPPRHEQHYDEYCSHLVRKRYAGRAGLVDFGGIAELPAGEFLGAGIWQLYKAIDSPYKSVLKLLLFEVYAADHPAAACLSADYKRAVCAGLDDIDELDPYVMVYRRIERHLLAREQPARLEIVRRCLYYKAGKKLSQPPRAGIPSWQRLLMERLVAEWGWDRDKLALLDSRSHWKIQDVEAERNELVKELTSSYRFLSEFARRGDAARAIEAREFNILGRRLFAAYERKAGKIDAVNPGRAINVTENEISIGTLRVADGAPVLWAAWAGVTRGSSRPAGRALRQAPSLSELLCWCLVNGVIGERTRIAVRERADGLSAGEVQGMLRELREHVLGEHADVAPGDEAFASAARVTDLLVFVNVAADPMRLAREQGLQRVSSRIDSLGYSALRENLVLNVETVARNSWGELVSARHAGVEGLLRCLRDFLPLAHGNAGLRVAVRCFCPSRAEPIATRVGEVLGDLAHHVQRERGASARYVLEIRNQLHVLQHRRGAGSSASADSLAALYEVLGEPQPQWSPLAIDRHALERTPLPVIAARMTPWRCSVFSEARAEAIAVTIVDEHGSLLRADYAGAREGTLLGAIAQFLESVRYRQNGSGGADPAVTRATEPPRFFRLVRAAGGDYSTRELPAPPGYRPGSFLEVQAIAEAHEGEPLFTVYCDGVAFSQRELGADFHARLGAHILGRRREASAYPVYLTDLDLSALAPAAGAPLQTVHYLRHRQRLEASINAALAGSDAIRDGLAI
ncbi:MAG: class I adenylate cyclase [Gammaproteobacteria bacterium]|nr:class I adenylate cyclase [Gammaproteobacteria bacterium]